MGQVMTLLPKCIYTHRTRGSLIVLNSDNNPLNEFAGKAVQLMSREFEAQKPKVYRMHPKKFEAGVSLATWEGPHFFPFE